MVRKNLLVALLFVFVITAVIGSNVSAASNNSVNVVIDGQTQTYSGQGAFTEGGYTFVPMRAIFEALGANIEWNNTQRKVTAIKGNIKVELTIGNRTAFINNNPVQMQAAPKIVKSSTMVPLRFVSESLGGQVLWDGSTRTAIIISAEELKRNPNIGNDVKGLDPKYYDPSIYLDIERYTKDERGVNDMLGFDFSGYLADNIFSMYAEEAMRQQKAIADEQAAIKAEADKVSAIINASKFDEKKFATLWYGYTADSKEKVFTALGYNNQFKLWPYLTFEDKSLLWVHVDYLDKIKFFDALSWDGKMEIWDIGDDLADAYLWAYCKDPMGLWDKLDVPKKYWLYKTIIAGPGHKARWDEWASPAQKKEAEDLINNQDL